MNTATKTKTLIRRPSRYQQNKAGYEITLSGLVMGRAIAAVQSTEPPTARVPDGEELLQSPDAWNVVHSRYAHARRKLSEARQKMAAGQTCANRASSEPTYFVRPANIPAEQFCDVCGVASLHGPSCFGSDCPRRITN